MGSFTDGQLIQGIITTADWQVEHGIGSQRVLDDLRCMQQCSKSNLFNIQLGFGFEVSVVTVVFGPFLYVPATTMHELVP